MERAIHLDTNYLIRFAAGTSPDLTAKVLEWIRLGVPIFVSAMAWAEFRCGPLTDEECTLVAEIISGGIPVNRELADQAGNLFNATGGHSRSLADCMIAAAAISEHASLATDNQKDFEPFLSHGLELV